MIHRTNKITGVNRSNYYGVQEELPKVNLAQMYYV